jgi:hypothetical protein
MFAAGCSLSRKAANLNDHLNESNESGNILENVARQNLTSAGFLVQKAEVEFNNQNGKQKFLATIRFEFPDKYLISLKSKTGLEGARIYISKDSLFVNDRINKKMYFGTTLNLTRKFGLNQSLLPLLFGDLVLEKYQKTLKEKCIDDKLEINFVIRGIDINYSIDCNYGKSSLVIVKSNYLQGGVKLTSKEYMKAGSILIPKVLEIEDSITNTKIRIRFIKIVYPWNGNVKFLPGKGYELIEL